MCTGDPTWGDPETDTMTGTWLPYALCSGHKSIHGGGDCGAFPFGLLKWLLLTPPPSPLIEARKYFYLLI